MGDKSDKSGFVYVMTKNDLPYYYKVGCTEKKPYLRAKELDGTDSPMPSIVTYYAFCSEFQLLESESHKALFDFRVRENREWFKCTRDNAISAIRMSAAKSDIELYFEKCDLDDPHQAAEKRVKGLPGESCVDDVSVDNSDFIRDLLVAFSGVSVRRDVEISENLVLYNNRISDLRKQGYSKGRFIDLCEAAREDYLRRGVEIGATVERSLEWCYKHKKNGMSLHLFIEIDKIASRIIKGETLLSSGVDQRVGGFISGCTELDDVMRAFTIKKI